MVRFTVDTNGSIKNIKVQNRKDIYGFYDESLRVVTLLSTRYKFTPARDSIGPINSEFALPINFVLEYNDFSINNRKYFDKYNKITSKKNAYYYRDIDNYSTTEYY